MATTEAADLTNSRAIITQVTPLDEGTTILSERDSKTNTKKRIRPREKNNK